MGRTHIGQSIADRSAGSADSAGAVDVGRLTGRLARWITGRVLRCFRAPWLGVIRGDFPSMLILDDFASPSLASPGEDLISVLTGHLVCLQPLWAFDFGDYTCAVDR